MAESLNIVIKTNLQPMSDEEIKIYKSKLESALGNVRVAPKIGSSPEVDKEIKQFQQHMENMMTNLRTKYGSLLDSSSIKSQVEDFNTALKGFGSNGLGKKDLSLQFETLTTNVKKSSSALRLATQDADSFFSVFAKDMGKMAIWGVAGTALFGTLRQIQNAITYVTELDNSLNEIQIVTGKTTEQVNALAKSYNNLAKEMNVTTKEIASEAANLFRQGLDSSQVEERMKAIIQYSKISSISLADSDKIITATANATGESVQKIIDIFALLGDQTASGADEIGEALQKVASAADNSGLSLEKSASWIATISSITRESASTIGRSINSIISRYESIKSTGFNSEDATKLNDVVSALSQIGITATDAQGQLRPFAEVMDEVGAKFSTLTKNEQAYITTTMFGTFQRNKGLTLLKNYNDSLKNYQTALNSAGTAEQKFSIYQESSQAALDKFTSTLEGLYQNTINSGFLKALINIGTGLVSVIDTLGLFNIAILTTIGYLTIVKGFTFVSMLSSVAKGIATVTMAVKGLSLSLATLTPLALVAGGMLLVGFFKEMYVSVQEQKQKVDELSNAYNSLNSKIIELKEIKNPTQEQTEYLKLLERELQIKNEILQTEKASLIDKDVFGKGVWGKGISGEIEDNIQNYEELQVAIKNTEDEIKYMQSQGLSADLEIKNLDNLKSQLKDIELSFIGNKKALTEYANSASGETKEKILSLIASVDNILPSLEKQNTLTNTISNTSKATGITTAELTKKIEEQNKEIDSLQSNAKDLASVYEDINDGEKISASTLLDLIQKYPEYALQIANINDSKEIGIELTKTLFEIEKQKTIQKLENDRKELNSEIFKITSIKKAYEAYLATSLNGALTGREEGFLNNIIDSDPLAQSLTKQMNGLTSAIEILKNSELPDFNSSSKKDTSPADKNPEKYKLELDRYAGLEQALNEVNNALEKNKTLQEQANNESIDLLDKELALLEQKKKAINDIQYVQKSEANDLRYTLESGYGINMNENGIPDSDSYDSVITGMVNRLNNMKSGDAYDALKTQIDNLKSNYERYIELVQTKIPNSTNDMLKIGTESAKISNDKISLSFKIAEKDAQGLTDKLDDVEAKLKGISDDDYTAKISAYKEEQQANNDLLWYWNQEMVKFEKGSEAWNKANEYAKKYTEGLNSATKAIEDLNQKSAEEYYKRQKELLESQQEDIENIVEMTAKMIKQQKQDELDAYKKIIEAKKESLEVTESEIEYQEELADKQKDISDIQDRLTDLARDNSLSAQAERLELEDELADKQTDLATTQRKHSVEIQKDALDDEYDAFEEKTNQYLDQEGQILADARAMVDTQSTSVYTALVSWNKTYGDGIESNITTAWNKATEALKSYKDESGKINSTSALNTISTNLTTTTDTTTALSDSGTTYSESSIVAQMKSNSEKWATASDAEKEQLHLLNEILAKKIGAVYNDTTGKWTKNSIPLYGSGTYTDTPHLAVVGDTPEFIIPKKNIMDFVNQVNLSSYSGITPTIPTLSGSSGTSFGDFNFNISGNVDETTAKDIVNQVISKVNQTLTLRGNTRNVSSFGF